MPVSPIKSQRLYQKVANQIAGLIESGEFQPGARLPAERELAASLHVSRPTIREAMIALEIMGIIEIRTGAGIFVSLKNDGASMTATATDELGPGPFELIEARTLIEGEAAALAAPRISETELSALDAACAKLTALTLAKQPGEEVDWEFHTAIARATRNSAVIASVEGLWNYRIRQPMWHKLHELIRDLVNRPDWTDDSRAALDHKDIVNALRTRDPDRARQAMRHHLERVGAVLLEASKMEGVDLPAPTDTKRNHPPTES